MKTIQNDDLQEKFDFLGLDLEKLPKFIKDASIPSFNFSKIYNDKDLKVYKFIPIDKIELLISPTLRSDDINQKFSESLPLKFFLRPDGDEEEVALFKTFSKIIRNMSKEEVEKIEKIQDEFCINPPFKVKYNRDHLWQIYYSEEADKYFMIICTKEQTFAEFLYLLKAQIEFSKRKLKNSPKIYVPINYIGYSEKILNQGEISDLENYLWLFTKNWPLIFEVYDDKNISSMQIVGETFVYKDIKSNYKVILNSRDEAIKFYKLMKALFILQTEIKNQYNFETKIDSNNEINMYLSKVEITFDTLTNFIKNEFLLADYDIKNQNKEIQETKEELEKIKEEVKEKETEYLQKQKEISTYLECKKTFIGKVKYFFKNSKKKQKNQNVEQEEVKQNEITEIDTTSIKTQIGEKEFYTIEDLVTIYALHEKGEKNCKNLKQDLKALKLKLENLVSKVRNANQYIEEIDEHKKSIFDFWKFANKDEKPALEIAEYREYDNEKNSIKKSFNFEMDFERVGEEADKLQRKKLSLEETDSIFIAQTELLKDINMVRTNKIIKYDLENVLYKLKSEFNENKLIVDNETFDIFGNISENNNKVKYIGSRSHRENEKNKFKIMNINKKIDIFDFTEKMQSMVNFIEGAIPKISSICDMPLYKLMPISKTIEPDEFAIYNINVENELEEYEENNESAYNLICLNYKEGMPLLYYTNIAFYDNTNKTLPVGMNLSSKVLVDQKRLEFILTNKTKFRTNSYFNKKANYVPQSKDIFVYEYDVFVKDEKTNISRNELLNNSDIINREQSIDDETLNALEEIDDIEIDENEVTENTDDLSKRQENDGEDNEIQINEDVSKDKIDDKNSKKLLKIQKKYEKEVEKQKRKEEKAKEKLEKKNKKK